MAKDILILNGPNLNMLGSRQPEVYGTATLADVESQCKALAVTLNVALRFAQSNSEAEIIGWIHAARQTASAIIINPGAFSHTSIAILDALNIFEGPVLEVHISNIHKRESFRHHSYVSHRADGVIAGCGIEGYGLALRRVVNLLS
jgi:3-dehydroquinate dehydratase II